MADGFVEQQTMESGPAAVVSIATDVGPAELIARFHIYNAAKMNPAGSTITLGPPSALAMRIRRGDILYTDPSSQVSMGMYSTGSTRVPAFASLAGIAAEINADGYVVRNNTVIVGPGGISLTEEQESKLLSKAFQAVWRRLRKVGVALLDYKADDLSQDQSGVSATLHGRIDVVYTGEGDVSMGDTLCLVFPTWGSSGGAQGSLQDLAIMRDDETRPKLKRFDTAELEARVRRRGGSATLLTEAGMPSGGTPEQLLRSMYEYAKVIEADELDAERRANAAGEPYFRAVIVEPSLTDVLDAYTAALGEARDEDTRTRALVETVGMIPRDLGRPNRLAPIRPVLNQARRMMTYQLVAARAIETFYGASDDDDAIEWYDLPVFKVVRGGSTNDLISVIFLQ